MKNRKKKLLAIILTTVILTFTVSGCTNTGTISSKNTDETSTDETSTDETSTDETSTVTPEQEMISVTYDDEDLDSSWDESQATKIVCDGTAVTIDGDGASNNNGTITISAAGTYAFSGILSEGQISIDAGKEDIVHIVLNGLSLTCSKSSAINGIQSEKITLTLAEGTSNEVTDAAEYIYDDAAEDEPNAAVFSKDDITINGTGTLKVNGNYQDGIRSKDDLIIVSGSLIVSAVKDGIKGKDSITVKDGDITITASGDGMQSNNDTEADKGYVVLEGGTYQITAGNDGIQAETILQIIGGTYQIQTGDGSAAATATGNGRAAATATGNGRASDMPPGKDSTSTTTTADGSASDTTTADDSSSETTTESTSMKGLKAGTTVFVTEGTLTIDSEDDTIHSNGNVTISGGELTLSAGDDGVHADSSLTVNGGTIDITTSYEGLEGLTIDINGGTIHVVASDDGLNAAGGNDSSAANDFGGDMSANEDAYIRMTDGYLTVDASGDGIDSNGNFYMDGGIVLVSGPTNDGNGAFDYNGSAIITGGIVIAAGSSGMAQSFSDTSTQNSILVYETTVQSANTLLNLSDASGNSIVSFAPSKDYQSVVISTPTLKTGETYTLSSGGNVEGDATDGYYNTQTYIPGTTVCEITIDSVSTIGGDTSQARGNGGGGGQKGGRPSDGGTGELPDGGMGRGQGEKPDDASGMPDQQPDPTT